MNSQNEILWNKFRNSLVNNVKNSFSNEKEKVISMLKNPADRKYLLKYDILPKIAKDIELVFNENEEFLRIDYTLFKKGEIHGWDVPKICIESENQYEHIYQEIKKLFSVNCPLKVLIIYTDIEGDFNKHYIENDFEWRWIFPDFIKENQINGVFAVIIINMKDVLKLYSIVYDETGEIFEDKKIILELE